MQLTAEVKKVLEEAKVTGKRLELAGQLDRKLYQAVAKAIELMGGKWDRKAQAHLFEDDAEQVVADAISTGAVVDFRKEFQFFETPPKLAAELVEKSANGGSRAGDVWLEPSAGRGNIAKAIREQIGEDPLVVELWEKNREVLAKEGFRIIGEDFLKMTLADTPYKKGFDHIVANPPFRLGQDVDHVMKMWELLAPGGRLVSVMSPGWRFKEDKKSKAFREFVEKEDGQWRELPAGSFVTSGTNVSTGVLTLDKG